jgi:cytochrome c oxidase subunit 4
VADQTQESPAAPRSKLYFQGKPIDNFEEVQEHVSPVSAYLKVLAALFVLTALTYAVSFANLGPASLPVAMVVAVTKAALVCAYFMHLRYDNKYHLFVFVSTILFVSIFFTFTLFDLESRDRLIDQQDTFFRRSDGDWSDEQRLKKARPVAPEAAGAAESQAPADGKTADGKTVEKAGDPKMGDPNRDTKAAGDAKPGDTKVPPPAKAPGG